MKILVLSNLYPPDTLGGYERGCEQVVNALIRDGHEVRVLTSIPRRPAGAEPHVRRRLRLADLWDHYSYERGTAVTARLNQARGHWVDASNVHVLNQEIAEFRPDVAYVWMTVGIGGLGLLGALEFTGTPWACHLMDDVPTRLCTFAGRVLPTIVSQSGRTLRGRFLSCGTQLLDRIEGSGYRFARDPVVVPNWVEGPFGGDRTPRVPGAPLRLAAAAATIDRRFDKGLDLAIEAGAILRDAGMTGWTLDLFGEVSDPFFPAEVARLGLDDRVRFRGPLPGRALLREYRNVDVFLFPTHPDEPFGFAALEAAAMGCVPVISEVCGLAEWFVHGLDCLKIRRSARGIAGALAPILRGEIDLASLSRRVSAHVRRDFLLDRLLPRIVGVLQAEAGDRREPRGTPDDAYRLAILAEKAATLLVQEPFAA